MSNKVTQEQAVNAAVDFISTHLEAADEGECVDYYTQVISKLRAIEQKMKKRRFKQMQSRRNNRK
jgi:hypothetical protein